ncbi:MAG: winged helix-turn-helix transcriptional regulator [Candidatus Zixiibacteriota bacterium]|nr:MAG: winged helix-turn-helix transcriptional regulator [candidate division Zixibacteria bacterium]
MEDYIEQLGALALASRQRRLIDRLTVDGVRVYRNLGFDFEVRWFTIFHLLGTRSSMTVTEIAHVLRLAHPSVIETTDEMVRRGVLVSQRDDADRRRRNLTLSRKGQALARKLEPVWEAFRQAAEEIFSEAGCDFLEAIKKMETALDSKGLYERIADRLSDTKESENK